MIVMDVEGLQDVEKGADYDLKLTALTVLLSSYIIYNSLPGVIDQTTLDSLSLTVEVTKYISNNKNG